MNARCIGIDHYYHDGLVFWTKPALTGQLTVYQVMIGKFLCIKSSPGRSYKILQGFLIQLCKVKVWIAFVIPKGKKQIKKYFTDFLFYEQKEKKGAPAQKISHESKQFKSKVHGTSESLSCRARIQIYRKSSIGVKSEFHFGFYIRSNLQYWSVNAGINACTDKNKHR